MPSSGNGQQVRVPSSAWGRLAWTGHLYIHVIVRADVRESIPFPVSPVYSVAFLSFLAPLRTGARHYFSSDSNEIPSCSRIFFSFFSASIWICRTRSRVTPISSPTSSSVDTE